MKEFLLLLKVDLLRLTRGGKVKGKQGGKTGLTVGIMVFFALLIVFMAVVYTAMFASLLPAENSYLALSIVVLLYCLIFLFSTVGTSKILFGASDYDMLSSMPIKPQIVILSKLAYVYIIGLVSALVCFVPSVITYITITKSGAIALLNTLLLIPFIPLVPLLIGLIVGTVYNILMARVKRKSLVGIILGGLFFIGYFYLMFGSGFMNATEEDMANALLKISSFLAPFSFIAKAITGNYLNLIIFALLTSAVGALYVLTFGKYYKKINGLISSRRTGNKVSLKKQKSTGVIKALVKKEFKTYFSNSAIVLNSAIGPIMAVVLGVVFIIKGGVNELIAPLLSLEPQIDPALLGAIIKSLVPFVAVFFIGISTFSSYSVSLEGKSLWFIKSLPIKACDWINAKLITNLIITLPAGVICSILFAIGANLAWYDVIISIVLVSLYSFLGTFLGLAVNLKYHNFSWTTPAEVVKRGASATICSLTGMFAVIPLVLIQFAGTLLLSPYLGFGLIFILLVGLNVLFYHLTYSNAEQKLLKMQ